MAAKRHLHDADASIDDPPEQKRNRQTDNIIVRHGNTTDEFDDEFIVSGINNPKIADENGRNSGDLIEKQRQSRASVSGLPFTEINAVDFDDERKRIENPDAQIEDFIRSEHCHQQQVSNLRAASPKVSAGAGIQKNHSHANASAGSFADNTDLSDTLSACSSTTAVLEMSQKSVKIVESGKCSNLPSEESDVVYILSEASYRSPAVENKVLSMDRPTPVLLSSDTITDPKSGVTISLSKYTYQKIPWLTGSKTVGRYFCWPCLLFSPEEKWSCPGNVGWKESSVAILNHQITPGHVKAFKTFKQREELRGEPKLSTLPPAPSNIPDAKCKNRRFFELLIDVLCSQKTKLLNTDMDFEGYEELMKVAVAHDPELAVYYKEQFSSDTLLDFISSHAGKVLSSIVHVVKFSVKKDIISAPYLSIVYKGTEKIADRVSAVAVIVRYVDGEGEVRERFLKFVKLCGARSAENIGKIHTSLVEEFELQNKLIGFSYCGTVVMPSDVVPLNNVIMSLSPKSKYFHCPDHNLKELLLQSLSHDERCQEFLYVISDLEAFFFCNSGAIPTLVNFVRTSDPKCPWLHNGHSFTHNLVSTLKCSYPLVLQFFERVSKKFWNDEVVRQAPEFVEFLTKLKNKFLIALVAAVLSCVDHLSSMMEKHIDPQMYKQAALLALSKLQSMKKNGVEPFMCTASHPKLCSNDSKYSGAPLLEFTDIFHSVIDAAIQCVTQRCLSMDTFYLGNPSAGFAEIVEDEAIMSHYADVSCGMAALKKQVDSFKAYELMFRHKSLKEHIKLMTSLKMTEDFSELLKFLRFSILVVQPKPSADSAIAKLKAYVKDKQRLSTSEVFLHLEKGSIWRFVGDSKFFDAVISHYVRNNNVAISP